MPDLSNEDESRLGWLIRRVKTRSKRDLYSIAFHFRNRSFAFDRRRILFTRIYLKLEGILKFARVFHHFYSFKSLIKLLFSTWVRFLKIISRIRIELNNAIQRWRKPYRARGEKNSHQLWLGSGFTNLFTCRLKGIDEIARRVQTPRMHRYRTCNYRCRNRG